MERLTYLLVLAGCVAVTLPLELVLGARVYRRPRLLAVTVLPVAAAFATWDLLAHARGHWWFNHRYVLGPGVFGLPVEEWLFFVVVPVCALLTYEAVGRQLARRTAAGRAGSAEREAPPGPQPRSSPGTGPEPEVGRGR